MLLASPGRPGDHPATPEPCLLRDCGSRPRGARPRHGPDPPPRLRLAVPVLQGPGTRSGPRRHAARHLAPSGGLVRGHELRRPPDAGSLGQQGAQHRVAVELHRQPVPSRRRVRGGLALHRPKGPSRLRGPHRRAHLCFARRRSDVGRRVLGEPQHGLPTAPPDLVSRRGQRMGHLGAGVRTGAGSNLRAGAGIPGPGGPPGRRHRLLRLPVSRGRGNGSSAGRRRPVPHPRDGDTAVLAFVPGHAIEVQV